jgi:uncharacterized protein YkwD
MKLIIPVMLAAFMGLNVKTVPADLQCLQPEEKKLYDLIMAYRKEKKLPPIPFSSKLSRVAQIHARDLAQNHEPLNMLCNLHSWSDKGNWTPCCYTDDHAEAECMWNKPKEIARYESKGYEISFYRKDRVFAKLALENWKDSYGHNQVIVNEGIWKDVTWKAIGIGIYKEFGVVWFGELADVSKISICN